MYGSFHLWIKVWVAVWKVCDPSLTHAVGYLSALEMNIARMNDKALYANVLFTLLYRRTWLSSLLPTVYRLQASAESRRSTMSLLVGVRRMYSNSNSNRNGRSEGITSRA